MRRSKRGSRSRGTEEKKSYDDVEKSTEEVVKELDFDLNEQDDDLIDGGNGGEFFNLSDIEEGSGKSLIFELPEGLKESMVYEKEFEDTGDKFDTLDVPRAALVKGNQILRTWEDYPLTIKTVLKNKLFGSKKKYKGKNQDAVLKPDEFYVRLTNARKKNIQGSKERWFWSMDIGFQGESGIYEKILDAAFED